MYFKAVLLHSHQKMQIERSLSATYYLLQGKPSIQTIQDGQIYGLNGYFGLYKRLKKERFFQIVESLIEDRLLEKVQENNYRVTALGKKIIKKHLLRPNYLQGSKYHQIDVLFFQRLLLFVQVFTNTKRNNMKFIPIVENREVELWLKNFYVKWKNKSDYILRTLYDELLELLSPLENISAEVFVEQLTGFNHIGLTVEQLAHRYRLSVESILLLHINTIHYFLHSIEKDSAHYPLLRHLSKDLYEQDSLTKSTKITKNLIELGYTLEEIAAKRRLRLNTIYDHVVEIALIDRNFSISPFVSKEIEEEIVAAVNHLRTYKLKEIKQSVRDEISYFQIRLVLAKFNEKIKESESIIKQ